jgi:hypothetical protein
MAHLQVLAVDHVIGEETVDEVDGQKQGFGHQLERMVHLHEPDDRAWQILLATS